jgi:hypothetical protein
MKYLIFGTLGLIGSLTHTVLMPIFVLIANPDASKGLLAFFFVTGVCMLMCSLMVMHNKNGRLTL